MPELPEPVRTYEHNQAMWVKLHDISRQVDWPVNGKMGKLSADDWKDIFSAELRKEQRVAQGISGGFVLLGAHTHKFKKREMVDMILIIEAFGSEHGVVWTEQIPIEAYEADATRAA